MSSKLSDITITKRNIMPPAILKRMQKTSVGLGDLHAGD